MISLRDVDDNENFVQEGESANITATFEFNEVQFNKAALLTLLLTLYDYETLAIINEREDQNVKDANGSSVATDGTLTLELNALDNVIVDAELEAGKGEQHVARLTWTWNDGNGERTGREELAFYVEKLRVPVAPA